MATVPVGQSVVPIFPAGQQGSVVVYNSGPSVIYLGDSNGFNIASGYPVKVGSTVTWSAGKALYACCDVGNTSSLVYSSDVDGVFDASAVAGQILSQGLAGDIANHIAVAGVPIIDAPIESGLISQHYTVSQSVASIGSLLTAPQLIPSLISCAKYQTLFVQMWESRSSTLTNAGPRQCVVRWYDTTGTIVLDHDIVSCFPYQDTTTYQEFFATTAVLPIKSTQFDIVPIVNQYDTQATVSNTIRLRYSLSYRIQSKRIVFGNPLGGDLVPTTSTGYYDMSVYSGMATASYSSSILIAGQSYTVPLPGIAGPALLTVGTASALASGQTLSFFLQDGNGGTIEINRIAGPTGQSTINTSQIIIPQTPLRLQFNMPAAPSIQVEWALLCQNS